MKLLSFKEFEEIHDQIDEEAFNRQYELFEQQLMLVADKFHKQFPGKGFTLTDMFFVEMAIVDLNGKKHTIELPDDLKKTKREYKFRQIVPYLYELFDMFCRLERCQDYLESKDYVGRITNEEAGL